MSKTTFKIDSRNEEAITKIKELAFNLKKDGLLTFGTFEVIVIEDEPKKNTDK